MKKIIIISGTSGSGHDAVIQKLKEKIPFAKVVTSTTRAIRKGEVDGVDYYFISKNEFENKIQSGEMMEWKKVYEDYKGFTKKAFEEAEKTGLPILLKLDLEGTKTIQALYPNALAIGIKPPSLNIVRQRLQRRQKDGTEVAQERIDQIKEYLKHYDIYDYVVVNEEGKLDETVKKVEKKVREYLAS